MATHKRQKISSYGINTAIVPNQVTDTINVDDSNIDSCTSAIKNAYAAVNEVSTSLTTILNNVNQKLFRGKTLDQLTTIKTYVANQGKYAEGRAQALDTQIKSDRDDMNTIVNSTKYLGTINEVLKDTTISASLIGLVGSMKTSYIDSIASSTGFTLNDDGTVTKGSTTYEIKDGKMSVVKGGSTPASSGSETPASSGSGTPASSGSETPASSGSETPAGDSSNLNN